MREWIRAILWVIRSPGPDEPDEDMEKSPPLDLVLAGLVEQKPPVRQFRNDRFRVSVFRPTAEFHECDCCGRPLQYLVLEFLDNDKHWTPMLTLHESHFGKVMMTLDEVLTYFIAVTDEFEREKKRSA